MPMEPKNASQIKTRRNCPYGINSEKATNAMTIQEFETPKEGNSKSRITIGTTTIVNIPSYSAYPMIEHSIKT